MAVHFSYADRKLNFNSKRFLKSFVAGLFSKEGRALGELNYVFCSDDFLLDINKRFLDHDYYTDIITFGLSGEGSEVIEGEIYISVDRVADNAKQLDIPFADELCRVVFHGALHLCGYGDKTKREIAVMRNKEDEYLRLYKQ